MKEARKIRQIHSIRGVCEYFPFEMYNKYTEVALGPQLSGMGGVLLDVNSEGV